MLCCGNSSCCVEKAADNAPPLQMSFAICLQVPNHLHFKNKRYIIAEFLPQILFMESIFGMQNFARLNGFAAVY